MLYKPKFFRTEELVSPVIFNTFGEKSLWFLDPRILWTADALRSRYGKITINNWLWKGSFTQRGFREPSSTVGAPLGQHRFGRALDMDVEGKTAEEVRQDILKKPKLKAFQYITCIESDVKWLHIDCRNVDRVLVVNG